MLIKFTGGGRGGGAEIAAYLTAADREGRGHAPPEVVRMEDQDALILPASEFATATVKQHFWEPVATAP